MIEGQEVGVWMPVLIMIDHEISSEGGQKWRHDWKTVKSGWIHSSIFWKVWGTDRMGTLEKVIGNVWGGI